ncbi:hypothetical protein CFT12S00416_07885 [Campylobacter fetus subsp. testudinum]|uniref:hypothetical protein n=1 Tax=Campylobacter fetus TaxID=196 RepID=UPI0008188E5A|nr:hypothetical protein [Campylobacter fetus]OCR87738.1 hypothetical protein CFT12S00416_07885 [Campylobacter fetus subsp. testudinum]OCR98881.1 hypothetical protein A9K75_09480 [Campylobacter fetus subsp. testudinum]
MEIIRGVISNLTVDSQRESKFPYYERTRKISFYINDKYCEFMIPAKSYLKNINDGDEVAVSCRRDKRRFAVYTYRNFTTNITYKDTKLGIAFFSIVLVGFFAWAFYWTFNPFIYSDPWGYDVNHLAVPIYITSAIGFGAIIGGILFGFSFNKYCNKYAKELYKLEY